MPTLSELQVCQPVATFPVTENQGPGRQKRGRSKLEPSLVGGARQDQEELGVGVHRGGTAGHGGCSRVQGRSVQLGHSTGTLIFNFPSKDNQGTTF